MFQVKKVAPHIGKIAIAAALLGAASLSFAATGGLYNTGVDGSGNALVDGATDSHYTATVLGGNVSPSFAVSSTETYGAAWNTSGTASKWITPLLGSINTTTAGDVSGHDYLFTTTFDLSGYDYSTATISGKFMSDNGLAKILVNGVDSGQTFGLDANSQSYTDWNSFSTLSGFKAGMNTLSFEVLNASGPTGLRTELASNFAVAAVPEPESYAMLLAGLGLMGAIARRRNKKQA